MWVHLMRVLVQILGLLSAELLVGVTKAEQMDMHQRHVVFDNSATAENYFHSQASVVAPSEFEIADGKCPVEIGHFVSPPNCLRLMWNSVSGGDWRVSLNVATRYGRQFELDGDTLSLWCYSAEGLSANASPRIGVRAANGVGLPDIPLLVDFKNLPAKQWVEVRIPFSSFQGLHRGTREVKFDSSKLASITLVQSLDDGQPHTLYLDDIRVVDSTVTDRTLPFAPHELEVEGFARHIDLTWQSDSSGNVCSYRVYRSEDGQNYLPIGTRPSNCQRYCDFVGRPGARAHYKVSAIDIRNNESSLSDAAASMTRELGDDALLEMVQQACFRYYWDAANRDSGMALEIWPGDENLVAVGASGFGVMALVVATEREFISREQSTERMLRIVRFLRRADRFHGVWPHFLDGRTGRVWPYFGKFDNGGDLVETAFLMQGLLTARQYFDRDGPVEREIRDTITTLWHDVEWDWFRKTSDGDVMYWHWSPDHGWHIGHPLVGWNETMIVYLLAIASPTHSVPASLYYSGWAGTSDTAVEYRRNWSRTTQGDHYVNGNEYYGIELDVGCGTGGDLFFTQFSFLGFDPRGRKDRFTNYFRNNRSLVQINRAYCIDNPRRRSGYGPNCWGRSAGVNSGGGKPLPRDDNGTICCSAALGCFPYTPEESMAALKHFYHSIGSKVWGVYGFHDGFNQTQHWFEEVYMGLNQAQIVVGIENYRTGLIWKQFMANPEVEPMLQAIGFMTDEDD